MNDSSFDHPHGDAVVADRLADTESGGSKTSSGWEYGSLLVSVDGSDHANRAATEAVSLAGLWHARVTAVHVYAARLHDWRFRQMEGGLPAQYREEDNLLRQREVHNELIGRGLRLIADSYHASAATACQERGLAFRPLSLEGKNYRELAAEANSGRHDLLVLGALGLGATDGGRLGTVCERVVRRTSIDTLVIKNPLGSLADGPCVITIDGSPHSYGGLMTALALARRWKAPVHVIAAFDPFFHNVAFQRINGLLSGEARKVFRFQEQERLHEEIIDGGLARLYQGYLAVARALAEEQGVKVETRLLAGKPSDAILRFLHELKPSLLVLGKLGMHADPGLDIGGTTERLLREAEGAVLVSQRKHQPRAELVAGATTAWTPQAEARLTRAPEFIRPMARLAILGYAQERGHTVITEDLVAEAMTSLCPVHPASFSGAENGKS